MRTGPKPIFISHGGGPMPLLGDPSHREMISCLKSLAEKIGRPESIIVVSAHWEEKAVTITSAEAPSLIYDYYGFPEESYSITYPCQGFPELAGQVGKVLLSAGVEVNLDQERGFDHGLFIPLKIMYPNADIPCIQLSLLKSMDPEEHIVIGEALRSLTRRNTLLIGSGFSFHNLNTFFSPEGSESTQSNREFEKWLIDTCGNAVYSAEERREKLLNWSDAPGARYCHPREEHLLPLHVCFGAAGGAAAEPVKLKIMNKESSMYVW